MKYKELKREQLEQIFNVIQKCFYSNVEWDLNDTLVDMAFVTEDPSVMKLLYDVLEKIINQRPETEVSGYALIHEVSKVLCTLDYWTFSKKLLPDDRNDPDLNDYVWVKEKRWPSDVELVELINSEVIYHGSGCTNYDYLKMCLAQYPDYEKICMELLKLSIPI